MGFAEIRGKKVLPESKNKKFTVLVVQKNVLLAVAAVDYMVIAIGSEFFIISIIHKSAR